MHPLVFMTIVSLVGIPLVTASLGALIGFFITLAPHKRKRKGVSLGAIVGLILGLLLAIVFNIYSWSTCAFCY